MGSCDGISPSGLNPPAAGWDLRPCGNRDGRALALARTFELLKGAGACETSMLVETRPCRLLGPSGHGPAGVNVPVTSSWQGAFN